MMKAAVGVLVVFALVVVCSAGQAPDQFTAQFMLGDNKVLLNITRKWSPHGADRFYELLNDKYYNDNGFFRVVSNFVVQFGINGDPATSAKWKNSNIQDDPVILSNKRGTLTFADAGPNTRTTQLFINYADNSFLDSQGFSPIGVVMGDGMKHIDAIYAGYAQEPSQGLIYSQGNAYLKADFPQLSYLTTASVVA